MLGCWIIPNAPKTKYMHLNPSANTSQVSSDGSLIELVQDFKYLEGYTDSGYDMNTRIGQAWSALNSLDKVWKAAINVPTHVVTLTQVGTSVYLGQTHLGTPFQVPAWVRKFSLGSTGDQIFSLIIIQSLFVQQKFEHQVALCWFLLK